MKCIQTPIQVLDYLLSGTASLLDSLRSWWRTILSCRPSARTSIGIRSCIGYRNRWSWSPLPTTTLTTAARTMSSSPRKRFSTIANFQKLRFVLSFLIITISPTEIESFFPFELHTDCSRKFNRYSAPSICKLLHKVSLMTSPSC